MRGKVSGLDERGKGSRDRISARRVHMADEHDDKIVEDISVAVHQNLTIAGAMSLTTEQSW